MAEIGKLVVKLQADTAEFTGDLGRANDSLGGLGDQAKGAGEKVDYSMQESREGVTLLGEELGIHLPRGVRGLIAAIGPLGPAFIAAVPYLGIAVGIKVLIEHFDKLGEVAKAAAEKVAEASEKEKTSQETESRSLAETNAKIEDQIRALEGKPKHNYIQEAIYANATAMAEWEQKSDASFTAIDKQVDEASGFWKQFTSDFIDESGKQEGGLHLVQNALAGLVGDGMAGGALLITAFEGIPASLFAIADAAVGVGRVIADSLSGNVAQASADFSNLKTNVKADFGDITGAWHAVGKAFTGSKEVTQIDQIKGHVKDLHTELLKLDAVHIDAGDPQAARKQKDVLKKKHDLLTQISAAEHQGVVAAGNNAELRRSFAEGEASAAVQAEQTIQLSQRVTDNLHLAGAQKYHDKTEAAKKAAEAEKKRAAAANKAAGEEASYQGVVAEATVRHDAALRALADTQASIDAVNHKSTDPDKEAQVEKAKAHNEALNAIEAADATYQAKRAKYEADTRAYAANAAKRREIDAQFNADSLAHSDALAQAHATEALHIAEADSRANDSKRKAAEELARTQAEISQKSAEQQIRFAEADYRSVTALAKEAGAEQSAVISISLERGNISWTQARDARIALIKSETQARREEIAKQAEFEREQLQLQINAAQSAAGSELTSSGGNRSDPKYLSYLAQVNLLKQQQIQLTKQAGQAEQLAAQQGSAAILKELTTLTPFQQRVKQVQQEFNQDFARMVVSGKNFGQSMRQLTAQLLEEWITYEMRSLEHTISSNARKTLSNTTRKQIDVATTASAEAQKNAITTASNTRGKLSDAKAAAVKAYKSNSDIPIIGPELGAIAAATTFAFCMAFANGGTVPGSGTGDTVPAMLSPGETVVSRALTEQVAANTGTAPREIHNHNSLTYAPNVSAIDATGVDKMLSKHAAIFSKHVTAQLRKQNRRAA